MVAPLIAAKAYAAVQAQASGAGNLGDAVGAAKSDPSDFSNILKNAMTDAVQSSKIAEQKMVDHVQGKADTIDVVTAIASAQASLQTVLAVRDQVISAYQTIIQMPI